MADSEIEWCDKVWNPVRGCSRVSDGCTSCYAMGQAHRFSGPGKPYEGLTTIRRGKVDWSGRVVLVPEMLELPLRWRKPRRVFVNSMSDLFHESLSNEEIAAVFGVMAACQHHTFQVLTKRARRMREWFAQFDTLVSTIQEKLPLPPLRPRHHWFLAEAIGQAENAVGRQLVPQAEDEYLPGLWPLPNVWLGVSAEDQQRADERIPDLLATPAAVRFVSAEPLLGPLDLRRWLEHSCSICRTFGVEDVTRCGPRIDWVIVGGESGHGARPCDLAWIRSIVEQCRDAGVACFVKQLGADPIDGLAGCSVWQGTRKGSDMADWPDDLRVREFPEVRP